MTDPKKDFWPDFLIIGAGKSGTTSLDNYLKQHPQIFMSKKKEPNFFAIAGMTEEERLGNTYYAQSIATREDYNALFREAPEGFIKGEVSNMYLYFPGAPERIKELIPDVKLIAILRDPVNRLYSRYLHLAREDDMPSECFEDCLDQSSVWWKRPDLVTEGFYYRNLSRFFELFPEQQIKIFLFEDLKKDGTALMAEICRFLGVDSIEVGDSFQYNKSGVKKSKLFDRTLGHNSFIKNGIKKIFPGLFKAIRHNTRFKKMVFTIQNYNLESPKLDPDLRKRMIEEIYQEDIKKLSSLIKRDLSNWLQ